MPFSSSAQFISSAVCVVAWHVILRSRNHRFQSYEVKMVHILCKAGNFNRFCSFLMAKFLWMSANGLHKAYILDICIASPISKVYTSLFLFNVGGRANSSNRLIPVNTFIEKRIPLCAVQLFLFTNRSRGDWLMMHCTASTTAGNYHVGKVHSEMRALSARTTSLPSLSTVPLVHELDAIVE